jgi:hypothetical protein
MLIRKVISDKSDKDLCANCNHPKEYHDGGLGSCSSYQYGNHCTCGRFKKRKKEQSPK